MSNYLRKNSQVLMNQICSKCGFLKEIVYRTADIGKDGKFHCNKCLAKHKPELYNELFCNEVMRSKFQDDIKKGK